MNTYDFVQLGLLGMDGEIRGKTKLQKTIYFLGVMTGHLQDLGYRAHFYGPYSEAVADAVNRLRSVGFVDQNIAGGGAVNELGFEICRYDYRLNDEGKTIARRKAREQADLWPKITDAATRLKETGERDYIRLSVAAKMYFLLGEKKGRATKDELRRLARNFGWKVTSKELLEAAKYLKKLGLVELVE